jgi:hypothetical protein
MELCYRGGFNLSNGVRPGQPSEIGIDPILTDNLAMDPNIKGPKLALCRGAFP